MAEKKQDGIKIVCENRKARHNYAIEDRLEAGMVLTGTEVKALRDGKAHLVDAYAIFKNNEIWMINSNISPYSMGSRSNHEALRTRKLLLNRSELQKLWSKLEIKGYSLIPLKIYFKNGKAKVEIALARGKKDFDKRETTKEREAQRELVKALRYKNR